MKTYGLGIIKFLSGDEQSLPNSPTTNFHISINLSRDEYKEIRDAISQIGGFRSYSELFSTVQWNFEDLVNTIRSYLNAFVSKNIKSFTRRDMQLNINKDLLNVLAAFRFYIDYMDRRIKNEFGASSELAESFSSYCSKQYDESFAYRFIYHLRNYAQHKGFVVSSINFGKSMEGEKQFQINSYLNVYISRSDLLQDKKLKPAIKEEIAKLPENIDVVKHVQACIDSLIRVHNQISGNLIWTVVASAEFIESHLKQLEYDKNDDRVMVALFETDHSDKDIKKIEGLRHIPLPIADIKQIIHYAQSSTK